MVVVRPSVSAAAASPELDPESGGESGGESGVTPAPTGTGAAVTVFNLVSIKPSLVA